MHEHGKPSVDRSSGGDADTGSKEAADSGPGLDLGSVSPDRVRAIVGTRKAPTGASLAKLATLAGWTVASFALFILVWWLCSTYLFNPNLVPLPSSVWNAAVELTGDGTIWTDVSASLRRVYVGLILGSFAGILLGAAIGRVRIAQNLVDPVLQFMRNLSPTAMIPIAIVWFGIGENSKYFLIFWGTVFFITVNTTEGVRGTPRTRLRAAQCLGASGITTFFRIVLPSSVPYIAAGVRLGVASAFMTIVPAELLAAQFGVGALLQQSSLQGQTNRMFVALGIIGILGFISDVLVRFIFHNVLSRFTQYQMEL